MLVETGKNSCYIEVFLIVCAIQNDISVRALESSKEKILSHLTYANTMDVEALYMKLQFNSPLSVRYSDSHDMLVIDTYCCGIPSYFLRFDVVDG